MTVMAEDLDGWVDLVSVPYTSRWSRLVVTRSADGALTIHEAAYERPLEDSVAVGSLRVQGPDGRRAQILSAGALGVHLDGGCRLVVTADGRAVLTGLPEGWVVLADGEVLRPGPDGAVVLARCGDGPRLTRLADHDDALRAVAETDRAAREWMARCPDPGPARCAVTARCWWVLGANTLRVSTSRGERECVVPSKSGYVGLWQWDAYFMAIGLRWGAPELALEQLRVAALFQAEDGQLPDVVHEAGVLASSEDLPAIDLENLRAMASPSLAHERVPLTKPPLLALAVQLLAEQLGDAVINEFLPVVLRNLDWWYRQSTSHGAPAYLHPYSSGLDDSPVFDDDAILASPDLATYLIGADRLAADWLDARGRTAEAAACRERAQGTTRRLLETWDESTGMFPALGESGQPVPPRTVVSLMPLLTGCLPAQVVEAMVADIEDPRRFGATHRLPTVAMDEESFSPERMWRGPVWVNTSWLVCRGLHLHGHCPLAREIEQSLLDLVDEHGPCEYFRPDTGARAPRATVAFGWSAALAVDIAMTSSHDPCGSGPVD